METFTYDRLHRLVRSDRNTDNGSIAFDYPVITYDYDAVGNIRAKSDYASGYIYSGGSGGGANAVKRVTKLDGTQVTFSYDSNGNMLSGDGRTVTYNAFNKPISIQTSNAALQFHYGADQMRYRQVKTASGSVVTTVYIDKVFEEVSTDDRRESKHYLGDFAVFKSTEEGNASRFEIAYLHRDHLGSMTAEINSAGRVTGTYSYDPFGRPRDGQLVEQDSLTSVMTPRGFTGHEHLNEAELIHMNGRAYDYKLGRFLSVDPIINSPDFSQSLNPYSYVMNNPLSGTDPTGYDIEPYRWGGRCIIWGSACAEKWGGLTVNLPYILKNGSQSSSSQYDVGSEESDELEADKGVELSEAGEGGTNGGNGFSASGFFKQLGQSFLDSQAQALAGGIGIQNAEDTIKSSIQIPISSSELSGAQAAQTVVDHAGSVMAVIGVAAAARDLDAKDIADNIKKIRVRHFTNTKGLNGIKQDNIIIASDQNSVFTVKARGRPGSPADVEKALGIKPGRGRNFVEFDASPGEVRVETNRFTGATEIIFRGDVDLSDRNPNFFKR
ncbi:hypothetical protein FKG94_07950 [Exilibacterium tricleocarpae]|uniref:Uncharacterized protein n=1 Tax=Exilibacterium tricleocarpae TaxID=2591008 RepID=A0A545TZK8_9GAMM|nr:RHS repeat-associated core domain-containing protein [Exilibacterium tricleocarpae]TQV82651.1 hypothetical protein FKG94_07950 [Exilibacterium tricleocarpae]